MKKRTGNKGAVPNGMQRGKVACRNGCTHGRAVVTIDWPIGQKPPEILCAPCKSRNGTRGDIVTWDELGNFEDRVLDWRGGKVKTYKPGDRGFKSRAKECTHISKITNSSESRPNYTLGGKIV